MKKEIPPVTPVPTQEATPSPTPVSAPEPTPLPTPTLTLSPTPLPTLEPTPEPTPAPTPFPLPAAAKKIEFESIIGSSFAGHINFYKEQKALISIIRKKEDPVLNLISVDNRQIIEEIDFSQYFVIMAFQGARNTGGTGIRIINIWQEKDVFNIQATFTEPQPGQVVTANITSPYYAAKVPRRALPDFRPITFRLLDQGKSERAIFVLKD